MHFNLTEEERHREMKFPLMIFQITKKGVNSQIVHDMIYVKLAKYGYNIQYIKLATQ